MSICVFPHRCSDTVDQYDIDCRWNVKQITQCISNIDVISKTDVNILLPDLNECALMKSLVYRSRSACNHHSYIGQIIFYTELTDRSVKSFPINVLARGVLTLHCLMTSPYEAQHRIICRSQAFVVQSRCYLYWSLSIIELLSQTPPINVEIMSGSFVTSSTLNHILSPVDNGQLLGCVVSHPTLAEPTITTLPITVFFAPIEQKVQTYKYITLQSDYEIRLNFSSYPQPNTTEWSFQSNFMKMPNLIQNSNDNSKFSTSLKDLGYDNYQAVLNIAEITQEDIQTKFKLHVANEMGEADYKVIL
ncbi:unnamed protein product, partial [Meganyctiphanes norvegica]